MTAIPDGFPASAEHWYGRWLVAQEQLDEEGAERIAGWPRAVAYERERIRQLAEEVHASYYGGTDEHGPDIRQFSDLIGARESTATCEKRQTER